MTRYLCATSPDGITRHAPLTAPWDDMSPVEREWHLGSATHVVVAYLVNAGMPSADASAVTWATCGGPHASDCVPLIGPRPPRGPHAALYHAYGHPTVREVRRVAVRDYPAHASNVRLAADQAAFCPLCGTAIHAWVDLTEPPDPWADDGSGGCFVEPCGHLVDTVMWLREIPLMRHPVPQRAPVCDICQEPIRWDDTAADDLGRRRPLPCSGCGQNFGVVFDPSDEDDHA